MNSAIQDILIVLTTQIRLGGFVYGEVQGVGGNASQQGGTHAPPEHSHSVVLYGCFDSQVLPILLTEILLISPTTNSHSLICVNAHFAVYHL